ncbi:hypothetical protein G9U51_09655 [Calidifontibacter sp. DB0510]|uniref:Cell division protein FtsL n=1 Tax=Metallococcus carri TaxID=1656884 RepID=A0A967EA94_9MICO|nr:hypothetical protein [Metallococcus carri]NHN56040.1 hypothetical protein [Metallococcus carri]NOP37503.1 hypothetical protein [Calidifontibacter sp. DB2511S]
MSNATVAAARPRAVRRAPARPQLRVVQASEATMSSTVFAVICTVLLAAGLLTVLLLNTARAQQQYAVDSLQAQSNRLAGTEQDLRSDLDSMAAPQQLALRAQAMGLRPATRIQYVRAGDGKVLGVAGAASTGAPFTVGTLPTTPASKLASTAVQAADGALRLGIPVAKPTPTVKPSTPTAKPTQPKPTSSAKPSQSAPKSSAPAAKQPTKTPAPSPTR